MKNKVLLAAAVVAAAIGAYFLFFRKSAQAAEGGVEDTGSGVMPSFGGGLSAGQMNPSSDDSIQPSTSPLNKKSITIPGLADVLKKAQNTGYQRPIDSPIQKGTDTPRKSTPSWMGGLFGGSGGLGKTGVPSTTTPVAPQPRQPMISTTSVVRPSGLFGLAKKAMELEKYKASRTGASHF